MNGSTEDEETTSLLGPKQHASIKQRVYEHLTVNVDQAHGDLPLLVGYIATGLLDSSAVVTYNCFVSMQTGNTIYLGLGLIDPDGSERWIKSLISIAAFCIGAFIFSRLHHRFGSYKRWVLMASYLLQALALLISASVVHLGPSVKKDISITAWVAVPLSLVAAQAAGQAYTSRALKFNGLTSVVLTSNYCDLFADPQLFAGVTKNPERNRRALAPIMLLLGAALGGVFARYKLGLEGALWTGFGLKLTVAAVWAVFPREKVDDDNDD